MLALSNQASDFWIPQNFDLSEALGQTTHLAIGAHQDDLEFMAYEGIFACYHSDEKWFTRITVTDGRGRSRMSPYSKYTDNEIHRAEQRKAAEVRQYAAQLRLDYKSSEVKGNGRAAVTQDIVKVLRLMKPNTVYLHQPADEHDTHIAVMTAAIEALRLTANHHQPERIIGCEMWHGLDWLADAKKVAMDFSRYPELFKELTLIFDSQITGGKRYDQAVVSSCRSNATFYDSHSPDQTELISWGIDLTPFIRNYSLTISDFILGHLKQNTQDIEKGVQKFS